MYSISTCTCVYGVFVIVTAYFVKSTGPEFISFIQQHIHEIFIYTYYREVILDVIAYD